MVGCIDMFAFDLSHYQLTLYYDNSQMKKEEKMGKNE